MSREQLLGMIVHEYHYQNINHTIYKWIELTAMFIVMLSFLLFAYCLYSLCSIPIILFFGSAMLTVLACLYVITVSPGTISRKAKQRRDAITDVNKLIPLMSNTELSLFSSEYTSWVFGERGLIDGLIDDAATLMLHSLSGKPPVSLPCITLKQRVLATIMRPHLRQTAA